MLNTSTPPVLLRATLSNTSAWTVFSISMPAVLVFNMPDLPQLGHSTRVFDNDITGNNTANFGAPGSAVASVPAGSGVGINSNDKVEIFNNRIGDNKTANVLISSLFSAEYSAERGTAAAFDPYPETIFI